MMQLRPYQTRFIDDIRTELAKHRRIIACAATGSGKSKTFIAIAQMAVASGRVVLVLTESAKIYSQLTAEITAHVRIDSKVKWCSVKPGTVYVAMAQSLARRPRILEQFIAADNNLLVITDEAHVGTTSTVLTQLPNAYHIGLTATPDIRAAKHLPNLYNACVVGPQPQELVELGYLAPCYQYARTPADLQHLKKVGGEFSEESQNQAFDTRQVFDGILTDLNLFYFKKCLIFCASIKHARHLAEQLRGVGRTIAEVHSGNANSDIELADFKIGSTNICVSVGILTKGFDFPPIDLVMLNRATTSLPLYLQMCGRGSRLSHGKSKFTVVDYGGNAARHGMWNFEHDWATLWNTPPKKKREGVAPIKTCPVCGFMCAPSALICDGCGHRFVPSEKDAPKVDTVLVELTDKFNEMRGRRISTLNPMELAVYAKLTGRKQFCQFVARAQGAVFLSEYAMRMGWKQGWSRHKEADPSLRFTDVMIR